MRHERTTAIRLAALALAGLSVTWACGGDVVVDQGSDGASGAGAAGASSNGSAGSTSDAPKRSARASELRKTARERPLA